MVVQHNEYVAPSKLNLQNKLIQYNITAIIQKQAFYQNLDSKFS